MYAILDIETTGGKYNEEGITEIAIHKFDGHEVVDIFSSLVNPEREIQPFVKKLTGINQKMLRTAPKFHEVAKRIVEITQNTILVAHNAQFDYRILRTEFRRLGYDYERKTLCTVELAQRLLPDAESHSLGKLVRSLGIPVSDRHRANGDALATLKLFKVLLTKDLDLTILKETVRAETLGELSNRQLDIVGGAPQETGVYYMHNKDGEIICIGSANNIRKKINQHFTNNGRRARQLQKETRKVTYERTGSELIALLKAHQGREKHQPKYLIHKGAKARSLAIYANLGPQGHVVFRTCQRQGTEGLIATFDREGEADKFILGLMEEFHLCQTINEGNSPETGCRRFSEGACHGACVGNESIADYNERATQAIAKYSLWDTDKIIVDKGRSPGEHSAILIKDGSFQGYGFYELNHQLDRMDILETIITRIPGDAKAGHIIETYLRRKKVIKILEVNP